MVVKFKAGISHLDCATTRVSDFRLEFLTFPAGTLEFITLGSNFSLFLRDCKNFSLFSMNFSLLYYEFLTFCTPACQTMTCRRNTAWQKHGISYVIGKAGVSVGRPVTQQGPAGVRVCRLEK